MSKFRSAIATSALIAAVSASAGTASAKVAGYAPNYANAQRLCSRAAAGHLPSALASHSAQLRSACATFSGAATSANGAYSARLQGAYNKQDAAWKKANLADQALNRIFMAAIQPAETALGNAEGTAAVTLNTALGGLGSLVCINRNVLIILPPLDQLACVTYAVAINDAEAAYRAATTPAAATYQAKAAVVQCKYDTVRAGAVAEEHKARRLLSRNLGAATKSFWRTVATL